MILDRLDIINNLVVSYPARMRESYFIKHNIVLYNEIINFCCDISDLSFVQKIWHWVSDSSVYFRCKCGNKTSFNRNWKDGYRKFCSAKCAQTEESSKEKRRKTNLEKYGVDNVAKSKTIQDKTEKTNLQKYGCKSSFQNKDVRDKWKKTIQEKYGVDHYFQTEEFKLKSKFKNLQKYGVDHFVKSTEWIEKTKKKNLEKYGLEWYTQTQEWLEKTKKTNISKFKFEWYQQREDVKNYYSSIRNLIIAKSIETNNLKWGKNWFSQTDEFKDYIKSLNLDYDLIQSKARSTMMEKYGVEFFSQLSEWKENTKKSNNTKWGKDWYSETEEWKAKMKEREDFYKEITRNRSKEFYKNLGYDVISIDFDIVQLKSQKCGHEFKINRDTFYKRISIYKSNACVICNPLNGRSSEESNVSDWIKSLGIEVQDHNRKICDGYEIDIFIPSHSLAIEFNGLYWHSELLKNKDYHLNKTNGCNDKGIRLIHIWEDDWKNRGDILKSIIMNHLNVISNKVYARSCEIKPLNNEITSNFLNSNHIQGYCRFSQSIGLYNGEDLVSVMTFGFRNINGKKEYELIRFCNKINTVVIGAASKLFNYFVVSNSDIDRISSYADISIFSGNLYKKLGFEYSHRSQINYWWVVDGIRRHRFNYNKKKLIKLGHDPLLTEAEIMHGLDRYRVWGCGQDKWIWNRNI